MTPADVAAIRAKHTKGHVESWYHPEPWCSHCTRPGCSTVLWPCPEVALCDALEAAWAEQAAALDAWHGMGDAWAVERERAERADLQAWADHESDRADRAEEAISNERQKVVNLTGELSVVNDHLADVIERAERAEAELALCRGCQAALARVREQLCDPGLDPIWDCTCCRDIRAAIEGP